MRNKVLFWDVDTQSDFIDRSGKLSVPDADKIKSNLRLLTNYGVRTHAKMGGSADAHAPGDPEFSQYPEHCVAGTPGAIKIAETRVANSVLVPSRSLDEKHIEELSNFEGQIIFEKQSPDISTNPNVELYIRKVAPEKIVVYGVVTEICVAKAVEYFLRLGYNVVVVEDAIKELDSDSARNCMAAWKKQNVEFEKTIEIIGRSRK